MAKSIVALYNHLDDAKDVVERLVKIGFPRENISLVANDIRNQSIDNSGVTAGFDEKHGEHGAATGAGIGAVLGGAAGLLAGMGAFLIPGIGPVVAAGPLIAALGGAGMGAVAGGVIGALTDAGVSEPDANIYAEGIKRGGTLVLAYASDEMAETVMDIMNRHNPVDINQRKTDWDTTWTGFDENSESFAFDKTRETYKPREPHSELDFGPGARSYVAGQAVANYDRGSANLANYQNVVPQEWHMYESRFREHFQQTYAEQPSASWEDYRDSYRFGFDMAHLPEYSNGRWDMLVGPIREQWESQFSGLDWGHYMEAVHDGFEAGHVV